RHYPRSNPVSVCGYHIREAGCTTAQEMAYGLAIAAAYVELMQARGMAVDDFAPRISFNFTCWGKIFEEVGKFRAGRRLYARMLREHFGAKNPKSWTFRSMICGGGCAFTVQEREDNIVRGAYIALAAALSGAQTVALTSDTGPTQRIWQSSGTRSSKTWPMPRSRSARRSGASGTTARRGPHFTASAMKRAGART